MDHQDPKAMIILIIKPACSRQGVTARMPARQKRSGGNSFRRACDR
jgi:hypothetical protein